MFVPYSSVKGRHRLYRDHRGANRSLDKVSIPSYSQTQSFLCGVVLMLKEMKYVMLSQDMCVMATVSGAKPHCSLMAYITDDDCRKIYMITHKQTTKYQNLTANPSVCLLIDTRLSDIGEQRQKAKALTVNGVFEKIENPKEFLAVRAKLLQRHLQLKEFASQPDAEVFAVKIHSLQLLKGATDAHFEILE